MVDRIIVKISPYMMEFLKRHREFSDLEPMETDENVIEIPSYKKARLDKLKEEMQNITCQSYLLTDNQYEMFQEKKELLLTDMEKEFDVKGNLYQYSIMADIPVIFHVNQQTSISCVVSNHPEDISVDSLITIDCNQQTSDCREIMHDRKEDYRLLEYESWNIPMNYHIGIHLTDQCKETHRWSAIFENCLEKVFKNDSISRTIGISLPNNIYVDLKKFSESIFMVFQNLLWNHERPIYILVFAGSEIMKDKIDEHLKKISHSKAAGGLPSQEISSGIVNNQFTVDVIEGLITELKVDVIVSSVDDTLNLKRGKLSSAILNKAGTHIQDECDRHHKGGLSFPKIVIANGYGLPSKYVFFGALPRNNIPNTNISTFIEKCLEKAAKINITSIAFPALGTGKLNYKPSEVAAQMESAIAKFKTYPRQTSLKKIIIVIYPEGTKGKDTLSKFKDTFAKSKDSSGTISKTRQKLSHKNEWISPRKYDYNHLQWVQFLNYSGKRERLDQAVHHFEKCLSNPFEILTNYPNRYSQVNEENSDFIRSVFDSLSDYSNISISQSEIKEILLFYDLRSEIKTTVEEQFESNLIQKSVVIPGSYADQFKEYLNELRTLNHNDTLQVPSDIESWKLQDSVKKICQQYLPIKCAISSDEKQVLFKDRNFENIQAAKYQLEIFLDLRETVSVSQDRFNFSETNSISSSDYKSEEFKDDAQKVKETLTFNSQNKKIISIGSDYDSSFNFTKISVSQNEVKELLLFYNMPPQIKMTVDMQFILKSMENSVLLPGNYGDQFKEYLNELRTLNHNDTLHVPSDIESSKLQHYVEKICQKYSPIKCAISSDEKQVLFRGLTFENIQAAKYHLELFLGLEENISINYPKISVSQSEVKEILLFYDLPSRIKTTVKEQFESNLMQNSVFVPGNYADQFKEYLNELRTLYHNDTLQVPSDIESSKLQHYVEKICQKYSPIKCAISSDEKQVLFRGLTLKNIEGAKYQLELFMNLRETVSVSQDRFNFSETNSISSSDYKSEEFKDDTQKDPTTFPKQEDWSVSPTVPLQHKPVFKSMYETVPLQHKPVFKSMYETVPSDHKPEFKSVSPTVPSDKKTEKSINEFPNISHQQKRISTMTFNSQTKKNIQDTDCFTIEDGFTVKIYQGDILTAHVDGIVNAANKYLMHGAGLARAIIKAAGDVVHTEGQAKLQDRKLNDGDVLSTSAGNLTRYSCIIHAVGPMRSSTNTDEYCRIKVAETVCNSLKEASRLGLSSVALPAISLDISPVPMHICTDGYFNGVMEFCRRKPASSPLKEVHFVDLNQTTCDAIKNHFAQKLGNF